MTRGRVLRWYSTATDIHDHKQSENKLRQDERELRQLIDFYAPMLCWSSMATAPSFRRIKRCLTIVAGRRTRSVRRPRERGFRAGLHPDDSERVQAERKSGAVRRRALRNLNRDSLPKTESYRWFSLSL